MTNELIKSKERVSEHGEVFTPPHIVAEMLELVQEEWSDSKAIFLEPTCGNGNFIVQMLQKRLDSGIKIFPALNTIFGMDIMQDNIHECHERVYGIVKDYLKKVVKCGGEEYKQACIKAIAIVENNIVRVNDSLVELDKSNGESNFEKKKFFKTDPTGNNMVLSEKEQSRIIKDIEKRWKAIQTNADKIHNLNDEIDECFRQLNKIENEVGRKKAYGFADGDSSQGEFLFSVEKEDPRVSKLNKQIEELEKKKAKIKNGNEAMIVFFDKLDNN